MVVASGIVVRNGRFLICKRLPFCRDGALWEFPTAEIVEGETAEDALEKHVFDCLSVQVMDSAPLGAGDLDTPKGARLLVLGVKTENRAINLCGYSGKRWVRFCDFNHFRLTKSAQLALRCIKNFAL